MLPITPAGRYDARPPDRPKKSPGGAVERAPASRPPATYASVTGHRADPVRRLLLAALAAICLMTAAATALAVFSPAARTLLALDGP